MIFSRCRCSSVAADGFRWDFHFSRTFDENLIEPDMQLIQNDRVTDDVCLQWRSCRATEHRLTVSRLAFNDGETIEIDQSINLSKTCSFIWFCFNLCFDTQINPMGERTNERTKGSCCQSLKIFSLFNQSFVRWLKWITSVISTRRRHTHTSISAQQPMSNFEWLTNVVRSFVRSFVR